METSSNGEILQLARSLFPFSFGDRGGSSREEDLPYSPRSGELQQPSPAMRGCVADQSIGNVEDKSLKINA